MIPDYKHSMKMVELRAFQLSNLHSAQQELIKAANHARMRGDNEDERKINHLIAEVADLALDLAEGMAVTEGSQ